MLFLFCLIIVTACNKEDKTGDNTQPKKLEEINGLTQFEDKILEGVSIMFFHATWCSICAAQRPALEGLTKDAALNKVFFVQVDFEKNQATNQKYNITGFPTIIIFKDQVEKHRLSGQGHSQDKLAGLLKALL